MMTTTIMMMTIIIIIIFFKLLITRVCNTGILYYVSSTLNPILYSVISHRYRRALHDTFCSSRSSGDTSRRRDCPGYFQSSDAGRDGRVLTYLPASRRGSTMLRASTEAVSSHTINVGNHRLLTTDVRLSDARNSSVL